MTKKILTREQIIHLAKLACLPITEEEIEKYREQLTETLDYIVNLNELKTDNIVPTNQSSELKNVLFKDGERNQRHLTTSNATANAKVKKDGYFVVKRIL